MGRLIALFASWLGKQAVSTKAAFLKGIFKQAGKEIQGLRAMLVGHATKYTAMIKQTPLRLLSTVSKFRVNKQHLLAMFGIANVGFVGYEVYSLLNDSDREKAESLGLTIASSPAFKEMLESFRANGDVVALDGKAIDSLYGHVCENTAAMGSLGAMYSSKTSKLGALLLMSLIVPDDFAHTIVELDQAQVLTEDERAVAAQLLAMSSVTAELVNDANTVGDGGDAMLEVKTASAHAINDAKRMRYVRELESYLGCSGYAANGEPKLARVLKLLQRVTPQNVYDYYEVAYATR